MAIPMVEETPGPGVWEIKKTVKAIMLNHDKPVPQYAAFSDLGV